MTAVSGSAKGDVNLIAGFRVDDFLGLFTGPTRCPACGLAEHADPLCAGCHADLPWNRSACPGCAQPASTVALCSDCLQHPRRFASATSAFTYEGLARDRILGLKYRSRLDAANLLGRLAAQAFAEQADEIDLLIPVPLHWRRLWQRGYNQSQELARIVAAELGLRVATRALKRVRAGQDQIGLDRKERRRNVRGAFVATRRLDGLRIALLDDVMTTGSTLDEIARCCRKAGARRVDAWSIARE